MRTDDKKSILLRWMSAFNVYYVTQNSICGEDFWMMDLLDESCTSLAGFCYGGVANGVAFKLPEGRRDWLVPCIQVDDPIAIGLMVEALDNRHNWHLFGSNLFFRERIAIDLEDFSWETIAINVDLLGRDKALKQASERL